jgi:hypothetical protein
MEGQTRRHRDRPKGVLNVLCVTSRPLQYAMHTARKTMTDLVSGHISHRALLLECNSITLPIAAAVGVTSDPSVRAQHGSYNSADTMGSGILRLAIRSNNWQHVTSDTSEWFTSGRCHRLDCV